MGYDRGKSCQDYRNQAMKDYVHMRYCTYYKSYGFHCPIHIKSIWVPAAKHRESQRQVTIIHQQHQPSPSHHHVISVGRETSKRPKDFFAIVISNTMSGGSERALSILVEMSLAAVFQCMRLSRMSDMEEQLAYQMVVTIGGHVFKGISYDQGPELLQP